MLDFFWIGIAVAFLGLAISSWIHRWRFMEAIYDYHLKSFKNNQQARKNLRDITWRHLPEGRAVDALRTTILIELVGFIVAAIAALRDSGLLGILLQGFS